MSKVEACRSLTNEALLAAMDRVAGENRISEVDVLAHLGELAERKLVEELGYPSLFQYCVQHLRFGEATAYWRIQAARAARDYPVILDLIESGELNVTTTKLIAPYLSEGNAHQVIESAKGKTRKEVEALIAAMQPSAPRRDVIVKCGPVVMAKAQWPEPEATAPVPGGGAADGAGARQQALDVVEAIDAERRRLHFDVGPDTAELLDRARQILRHKFPFASLEDIVKEALNVLLDHKDLARRLDKGRDAPPDQAEAKTADPASRDIPMWVRRAVYKRDDGRCAFVGDEGRACGERSWLEFDHVIPFAQGGRSDDPGNVRLLCRAHNRLAADRAFAPKPSG